ncbi:MAG: hypothetical protein AB1578_08285 [Thermodesulfobacteriota bacterium]
MPKPADSGGEPPDALERLPLYRRAARVLEGFCGQWLAPFCAACLEVTGLHHRDDPRADAELLEGIFPGCCQAGVADALWVPGSGEEGRFPAELARALDGARARAPSRASGGGAAAPPPTYRVRERHSGLVAEGVSCAYLGPGGCRLGELKAPLCLCYACEAVLEALRQALLRSGSDPAAGLLGSGTDDFCGSQATLRAVVSRPLGEARSAVDALSARVAGLDRALAAAAGSGAKLLAAWRRGAGAGRAVRGFETDRGAEGGAPGGNREVQP